MLTKATAIAIAMGAGFSTALAQPAAGSRLYRLTEKCTWQQGCFEPCRCPMSEPAPVAGTFRLTPQPSDGLFDLYAVTDAEWVVTTGAQRLHVAGKGFYRVRSFGEPAHQLELDLQTDAGPIEHFDSGIIAGGSSFPTLDIEIDIHDRICFDTVIHIVAEPARPIPGYRLAQGSTWQQGCFLLCDCVLREPVPITGTFLLSYEGTDPLYSTYAVTDVDFRVEAWDGPRRIVGSGTYEIGGEFALTQRLRLDLSTNGGAVERFDSGVVPGGSSFPAIDIEVDINDRICFDTVIRVLAKPAGDYDLNGSVDQADFALFQACLSGPSIQPSDPACGSSDLDDDHDVDMDDFGVFQRCLTGPGAPMDPACAL